MTTAATSVFTPAMLPRTKVRTNAAEIAKGYCNRWDPPLLFTLWAAQALVAIPISVKKKGSLGKLAARELCF